MNVMSGVTKEDTIKREEIADPLPTSADIGATRRQDIERGADVNNDGTSEAASSSYVRRLRRGRRRRSRSRSRNSSLTRSRSRNRSRNRSRSPPRIRALAPKLDTYFTLVSENNNAAERMRANGSYEFYRYRNLHLLSLNLYSTELDALESEIWELTRTAAPRDGPFRYSVQEVFKGSVPIVDPAPLFLPAESRRPSEVMEGVKVAENVGSSSEQGRQPQDTSTTQVLNDQASTKAQIVTPQMSTSLKEPGSVHEDPSTKLEAKMDQLRAKLKAYGEAMLLLEQLMRLRTSNDPDRSDFVDLNTNPPTDPLRTIIARAIVALGRKLKAIWTRIRCLTNHKRARNRSRNFQHKKARAIADVAARFLVAVFGGALLIVPMVLMTFLKSQNHHLLISSVFTVGFAMGISLVSTASNQEILAATAAYAAVLVVFVGTSPLPS